MIAEGNRLTGPAAVHLATIQADELMLELLLQYNADITATACVRGNLNMTCLHLAAEINNTSICRVLLERDPKVKEMVMETNSLKDLTAMHWACMHRQQEATSVLLEFGCDVNVRCSDFSTPLHFSCLQGDQKTVETILNHGVEFFLPNKNNLYPIHMAIKSGNLQTLKLLIKAGCDIHVSCNDMNVLQMAVEECELKMVELLIDSGIEVNKRVHSQYSALHLASDKGYASIVEALLKKGAQVNSTASKATNVDVTSLHLACLGNHKEVVSTLIKFNANVNATAKVGFLFSSCYFYL